MDKKNKNNGKYGISVGLKTIFIILIALAIIFPFYLIGQSGVSPWLGWLSFILMIAVPTFVGVYVHRMHKNNPAWRKDHAEMIKEKQESQEIMKNGYKPKSKTTKAIEAKPKDDAADNNPIRACSFCGKGLGLLKEHLQFKDGFMDSNCIVKYGMGTKYSLAYGAKAYAQSHTVQDFKDLLATGKNFADIQSQYMTDNEKANAKYQKELAKFKSESALKIGAYYFDLKNGQILQTSGLLRESKIYYFKDILSYHVNQRGHNEFKHHGITRAVVGGALAGGVGAIVGSNTGGKHFDVIDHLGVIINMADGSNFEVVLTNSQIKPNTMIGRQFLKMLDNLISVLQAGMQKYQNQTQQQPAAAKPDPADEIAKFKKLADQGIITKDEFKAKKKQLLGL